MDGLIPLVGIGAGVIGATVLTPLLTVPILNVFGFSAAGPVAGTFVAGVQSSMGNVAAGGLFATLQGAAMGAGIPASIKVVGGVITGFIGMAAAAIF